MKNLSVQLKNANKGRNKKVKPPPASAKLFLVLTRADDGKNICFAVLFPATSFHLATRLIGVVCERLRLIIKIVGYIFTKWNIWASGTANKSLIVFWFHINTAEKMPNF